jgi:uncharacterized membrane protein
MFFSSKQEVQPDEQPVAQKIDPYAKLRAFYFREIDGHKLILTLANQLKTSNAIMSFDDGTIWKVSYLGEVLEFLNNTIQQIGSKLQPNAAMAKWLDGELPVNLNPKIEISPEKIVDYAVQALRKYPTNEYSLFVEQMENFKIRFDDCEIVENLRK